MTETIGVIGAGTMGNGIAQVAARSGYNVIMRDVSDEFLHRGVQSINQSLQRDIAKQRLTEDEKKEIVGRIEATTDIQKLSEASFVIEAVTENLDVKTEIFKTLDHITDAQAILASNTSSISIPRLGAATARP